MFENTILNFRAGAPVARRLPSESRTIFDPKLRNDVEPRTESSHRWGRSLQRRLIVGSPLCLKWIAIVAAMGCGDGARSGHVQTDIKSLRVLLIDWFIETTGSSIRAD
jgi:hypothetical protein